MARHKSHLEEHSTMGASKAKLLPNRNRRVELWNDFYCAWYYKNPNELYNRNTMQFLKHGSFTGLSTGV